MSRCSRYWLPIIQGLAILAGFVAVIWLTFAIAWLIQPSM